MVIEKIHGLKATGMSLNERFTMLASVAPIARRRPFQPTIGSFLQQSLNIHNQALIEQIARTLQYQTKKRALRQRLGQTQVPGLRQYGSESNMLGLQRFNKFNNKVRQFKQNLSGNLNRAASFSNLSGGARRVRKRAGVPQWRRGNATAAGGAAATAGARRGARRRIGLAAARMARLRARLDAQLERYMATAPAVLDRDLDLYHALQPDTHQLQQLQDHHLTSHSSPLI